MPRIALVLAAVLLAGSAGCKEQPEDRPVKTQSFFSKGGPQGTAAAAEGKPIAATGGPATGSQGTGRLPPGHPPIGAMAGRATPGAAPSGPATQVVSGTVSISPKLKGKVPHGVLFLFGRMPGAGGAKGPPVVVLRVANPTFPMKFDLTSANTMMPGIPIPAKVKLGAILDQDGDAVSRTPGDLSGALKAPVKKGTTGVRLVLDTVNTVSKPGINVGAMGGSK